MPSPSLLLSHSSAPALIWSEQHLSVPPYTTNHAGSDCHPAGCLVDEGLLREAKIGEKRPNLNLSKGLRNQQVFQYIWKFYAQDCLLIV